MVKIEVVDNQCISQRSGCSACKNGTRQCFKFANRTNILTAGIPVGIQYR